MDLFAGIVTESWMIWRWVLDTGMAVLILLVQLIIYPSFLRIEKEKLHRWHEEYTGRITLIVCPLMLLQLGVSWGCFLRFDSVLHVVHLVLVSIAWMITFGVSVPIHKKISKESVPSDVVLTRLINTNIPRTVCWLACWGISLQPFI